MVQDLIIRDSSDKNTEQGIQRSQWVHASPCINCVYPIFVPRMVLVLGVQRSETRLALERLIDFRGVFGSLLKAMVCGKDSLCCSKLDSALIVLKS